MTILDFLFGCTHRRTSFPISGRRGIYIVCLSCGKEFPYSWEDMKIVKPAEIRRKPREQEA